LCIVQANTASSGAAKWKLPSKRGRPIRFENNWLADDQSSRQCKPLVSPHKRQIAWKSKRSNTVSSSSTALGSSISKANFAEFLGELEHMGTACSGPADMAEFFSRQPPLPQYQRGCCCGNPTLKVIVCDALLLSSTSCCKLNFVCVAVTYLQAKRAPACLLCDVTMLEKNSSLQVSLMMVSCHFSLKILYLGVGSSRTVVPKVWVAKGQKWVVPRQSKSISLNLVCVRL